MTVVAHFNFGPIRSTAIGLIKKFGRAAPCVLLRNVTTTPADANKPWRGDAATIKQFKFTGIVNTISLPVRTDPAHDRDVVIFIPGDIVDVAAEGDSNLLCGEVQLTDQIQSGDTIYGIAGMQDVTPDDKTIFWKVHARAWPQLRPQATGGM